MSSPFSKSFVFEVFSVHKKTQSCVFKFFRFDERLSVDGRPNPRNNDTFSKNILYGAVWTKPLSSPTRKTIQWERLLVFLVCKFNSKRVSQPERRGCCGWLVMTIKNVRWVTTVRFVAKANSEHDFADDQWQQ